MTLDEQQKIQKLTAALFPAKVAAAKKRGTVGQAQHMQLQWHVYNALIGVGISI